MYCIAIRLIKKCVEGEIIFVNIYDHCKTVKVSLQYIK